MFKVQLKIMPRKGILNPQSSAVTRALGALGYSKINGLEMGRMMEFTVKMEDEKAVEAYVEKMCQHLLANPIIEDYTYQIKPVEGE